MKHMSKHHRPIMTAVTVLLLSVASSGSLYAQFSIDNSAPRTKTLTPVFGEFPQSSLQNDYYDPAAVRAEKLRLRKERNTIEFNSSLETSLQQFHNWTGSVNDNFYALANIFFRHQYKRNKLSIDYSAEAKYGMNYIEDAFFKNVDEFKLGFQFGWFMHRNWSYSASTNLRSQFTAGYESRTDHSIVSDFMSPGYFDVAVGFSYARPNGPIKITLSPVSGNIVTVLNPQLSDEGMYGVFPGRKSSSKIGYSADIFFDRAFGKSQWLRYRSNLYCFMPYAEIDNPTVRWENTVEIKITKVISTKLYGQLYYRKEDSLDVQYQYSFMIGLNYVFKNK